MLEKIIDSMYDKMTEVFAEIQTEYGITCGDCDPMEQYELEKRLEYLAEQMKTILEKQANPIEWD